MIKETNQHNVAKTVINTSCWNNGGVKKELKLRLYPSLPTKSNSKYILSLGVKCKPIKLPEGITRNAKMVLGIMMTF